MTTFYLCVFAEGATDKHALSSYDYIFRCALPNTQDIRVEEFVFAQQRTYWFPTSLHDLQFLCSPPLPVDATNICGHLETATLSYKDDSPLKFLGIVNAPRVCMETVDHLFASYIPHTPPSPPSQDLHFFGLNLSYAEDCKPGEWDFAAYVRHVENTRYVIEKLICAHTKIRDAVLSIGKGTFMNIFPRKGGFAIYGPSNLGILGTSCPDYSDMYSVLEYGDLTKPPRFNESDMARNLRHVADTLEWSQPSETNMWTIQESIEHLQSLVNELD